MQMLCRIFPILSLQQMKGSSFEQFLVLKKKNVFYNYYFFTIYRKDSQWSYQLHLATLTYATRLSLGQIRDKLKGSSFPVGALKGLLSQLV